MNRRNALLGIFGAGLATTAVSEPARAAISLRLATLPIDGTALAYYAKDLNYFQAVGIDVTIESISNGAVITSAVLSNSIDIGWSNIISLAAAYKRGLPVVIIGAGGIHTPGSLATQLMVLKDSPIRTARDLTGKVIGCTGLANVGQFAPELWIDQNGGQSNTVKFIEVPLPQLPAALEQNRVDAAWLAEPFIKAAEPFARTFATCFDAVAPRWMLGAWFTTPAWERAPRRRRVVRQGDEQNGGLGECASARKCDHSCQVFESPPGYAAEHASDHIRHAARSGADSTGDRSRGALRSDRRPVSRARTHVFSVATSRGAPVQRCPRT